MMISDVYRTLWRNKVLAVAITLVVVATAFALTSRETKLYTAGSLVRVQQTVKTEDEVFGALLTGERLARTYERIAETYSVREIVNAGLPEGISSDTASIDATQLSNLELLHIAVTDPDPEVAAAVANEVPKALSRFIRRTGTFQDTITVVERAGPPSAPSSPNLKLNLTLALMLGLILGGGLALLKESFADRINDVEELEKVVRHPVIATIPNLKFAPLPKEGKSRQRRVEVVEPARGQLTKLEAAETAEAAEAAEGGGSRRWSSRG